MTAGNAKRGKRFWGLVLLLAASVPAALEGGHQTGLPHAVRRVGSYFQRLNSPEARITPWERLVFSLMLANTKARPPATTRRS